FPQVTEYATLIAVVYSMVKQNYAMQCKQCFSTDRHRRQSSPSLLSTNCKQCFSTDGLFPYGSQFLPDSSKRNVGQDFEPASWNHQQSHHPDHPAFLWKSLSCYREK
ncbi:hypothetical protein AALP_AAs57417U000100, partial [Arabis alpina]